MALWIQFSIDQLSLVEQIESIAFSKNIGSSKDSFVSMDKPKKLYSGNVKITLSDSLTKKTGSFIVKSKNTSPENISQEFDTILKDFVPDETKETLKVRRDDGNEVVLMKNIITFKLLKTGKVLLGEQERQVASRTT